MSDCEFQPAVSRILPPECAVTDDEFLVLIAGDTVLLSQAAGLPRGREGREALPVAPASGRVLIGSFGLSRCTVMELKTASGSRPTEAPPHLRPVEIRHALAILGEAERTALGRARALLHWRRCMRYCGGCGAPLADMDAECARRCDSCGQVFYPQVSPAVITAVTDCRGRLLLAHNSKFRAGLYSLVAGFVEPGESLEAAVAREVREEVGLEVRPPRYFGSQSWPFPNALMAGFFAECAGPYPDNPVITPDGEEITDAFFVTPDAMPDIPPPGSISRTLIDHWRNQYKKDSSDE